MSRITLPPIGLPVNLPPRTPAAVAGTDPRGWLAFAAPLPDELQRAEDATADADCRRHTTSQRPATATERLLLAELGYLPPDFDGELFTRVRLLSEGVRRRTWPQLSLEE